MSSGTAKADQKWSQTKKCESSVHADCIFSKQNGRTVPSETERCIDKLARVPSLQISFFRGNTAAQYPACQRGESKKWREFRPCRSHFVVAKRPHSTQRAREVSWENWREFRLCTRLFFLIHGLHSTQQTRKLRQKIGEHSVHVHDCFPQCIGHRGHSEPDSWLEKIREFRPCKRCSCSHSYLKN